jgi:hypothetical protein
LLGIKGGIHDAWINAQFKINDGQTRYLSTHEPWRETFKNAKEIYDTLGRFNINKIVCDIISKLCDLTDDQYENLSNFIKNNSKNYRTVWQDDHPPSWPFFIDWIITFKKGVLSCWEEVTASNRKEIQIANKIQTGKQPKFVIDNAANKQRVPRDDETSTKRQDPSQIAADDVAADDVAAAAATAAAATAAAPAPDFLLVTYTQREEKWTDNRYNFLKTETKKVFFEEADRAPDDVEEQYTKFLRFDATRNFGSEKYRWKDANNYLKEISDPGQDFTHERPL